MGSNMQRQGGGRWCAPKRRLFGTGMEGVVARDFRRRDRGTKGRAVVDQIDAHPYRLSRATEDLDPHQVGRRYLPG